MADHGTPNTCGHNLCCNWVHRMPDKRVLLQINFIVISHRQLNSDIDTFLKRRERKTKISVKLNVKYRQMTKLYFSFYLTITLKTHHLEDKLQKSQALVDNAANTGRTGPAGMVLDTAC